MASPEDPTSLAKDPPADGLAIEVEDYVFGFSGGMRPVVQARSLSRKETDYLFQLMSAYQGAIEWYHDQWALSWRLVPPQREKVAVAALFPDSDPSGRSTVRGHVLLLRRADFGKIRHNPFLLRHGGAFEVDPGGSDRPPPRTVTLPAERLRSGRESLPVLPEGFFDLVRDVVIAVLLERRRPVLLGRLPRNDEMALLRYFLPPPLRRMVGFSSLEVAPPAPGELPPVWQDLHVFALAADQEAALGGRSDMRPVGKRKAAAAGSEAAPLVRFVELLERLHIKRIDLDDYYDRLLGQYGGGLKLDALMALMKFHSGSAMWHFAHPEIDLLSARIDREGPEGGQLLACHVHHLKRQTALADMFEAHRRLMERFDPEGLEAQWKAYCDACAAGLLQQAQGWRFLLDQYAERTADYRQRFDRDLLVQVLSRLAAAAGKDPVNWEALRPCGEMLFETPWLSRPEVSECLQAVCRGGLRTGDPGVLHFWLVQPLRRMATAEALRFYRGLLLEGDLSADARVGALRAMGAEALHTPARTPAERFERLLGLARCDTLRSLPKGRAVRAALLEAVCDLLPCLDGWSPWTRLMEALDADDPGTAFRRWDALATHLSDRVMTGGDPPPSEAGCGSALRRLALHLSDAVVGGRLFSVLALPALRPAGGEGWPAAAEGIRILLRRFPTLAPELLEHTRALGSDARQAVLKLLLPARRTGWRKDAAMGEGPIRERMVSAMLRPEWMQVPAAGRWWAGLLNEHRDAAVSESVEDLLARLAAAANADTWRSIWDAMADEPEILGESSIDTVAERLVQAAESKRLGPAEKCVVLQTGLNCLASRGADERGLDRIWRLLVDCAAREGSVAAWAESLHLAAQAARPGLWFGRLVRRMLSEASEDVLVAAAAHALARFPAAEGRDFFLDRFFAALAERARTAEAAPDLRRIAAAFAPHLPPKLARKLAQTWVDRLAEGGSVRLLDLLLPLLLLPEHAERLRVGVATLADQPNVRIELTAALWRTVGAKEAAAVAVKIDAAGVRQRHRAFKELLDVLNADWAALRVADPDCHARLDRWLQTLRPQLEVPGLFEGLEVGRQEGPVGGST